MLQYSNFVVVVVVVFVIVVDVVVVIIKLFPNNEFQFYCPKDYYKQKQWNTLVVTMITEIMNFNRLLWWLPWHRRLLFVFGDLQ